MLRSLLIGVNGSQNSRQACELGLNWAKSHLIPVTCIGVVDIDAVAPREPVPMGAAAFKTERDTELLMVERRKVEEAVRAAGNRAHELGVECHLLVQEGNAAETLSTEAQRHDLMILGRRSLPQTDRDPPPSKTLTDILRYASRPVVVAGHDFPMSSNVVVAYDGSAQAARTLHAYVQSGLHFGHPLHLVGVNDDSVGMQLILMRALDYLKAHGRGAELHVLPVRTTVANTLSQFVRQLPCGLLVMGVYGQPLLKELLFGSVTKSLLHHVPAPMFLHH
jgi:nucleotide-binding universal stress UspA family protein